MQSALSPGSRSSTKSCRPSLDRRAVSSTRFPNGTNRDDASGKSTIPRAMSSSTDRGDLSLASQYSRSFWYGPPRRPGPLSCPSHHLSITLSSALLNNVSSANARCAASPASTSWIKVVHRDAPAAHRAMYLAAQHLPRGHYQYVFWPASAAVCQVA